MIDVKKDVVVEEVKKNKGGKSLKELESLSFFEEESKKEKK